MCCSCRWKKSQWETAFIVVQLLEDRHFFPHHGVEIVSKLIQVWANSNGIGLSAVGHDFIKKLGSPFVVEAKDALLHEWIKSNQSGDFRY
jgi:hypothetical protein